MQGLDQLQEKQRNVLIGGNVIYIYRSKQSRKIYIGQTRQLLTRHQQHYSGKEEKFQSANFDEVMILLSQYFHRSALDDVENQLITYFMADNSKFKAGQIEFNRDEVINGNRGNAVHDYPERDDIFQKVLLPFWEQVLVKEQWVQTDSLDELRNRALVKYSPIKQLTEQQQSLIDEIINHSHKNYVINGDAGTGKTVLLTHLVASLRNAKPHSRIAIVVQPNWTNVAEEIFKIYGLNDDNLIIGSSTQVINTMKNYDIIIVDESHKLSRRGAKQHPSFNTIYHHKVFKHYQNHLEPLIDLSNQLILMYDVLQAIRPANISRAIFTSLTSDFEQCYLKTQFRIQAPVSKNYTSDDYINGIKYLLYKDTGLLEYTNFNPNFNREVFHDNSPDAYFGYFENQPLQHLIDWIEEDRNYHPNHLNRVLAGLVEDWKQKEGKNPTITHFHEGDIKRRWNSTQVNWIASKDADGEDQIGSVFAVQGIDLNKVGVLIGNDLLVDSQGRLYGEPKNFKNVNGKHTVAELEVPENRQEFTIFVLNIYYVLLTRGIDGIRLGFWHNDDFKEYLKSVFKIEK
ncbi:DUF2075 domain-containing protein [Streptococcus zhangguiae]|uniref:DUF2075 domain-containing protein n=1 Tax=Streptococcus zhangguiae TaxID=2664091 RepID=UPI001E57E3AA|nr:MULTISPECIES: DUF2075 domain-containing protein [unclassified Streptococcus]